MPKRSLMLAGGGVKIAFQAGALQVWLDEAGIEFDHADAVSAACFNLAMWAQGMSGTQIANNWRTANPLAEVDVNVSQLARLLYAASIFDLDAFRHKIFPAWGLDMSKIRSSGRLGTFNVYNFSKHELRPVPSTEMTEDLLIAAASLPMWFPPIRINGDTYIDAVLHRGTNIDEAIRRGADELWIIWTTSERGEWFDGFVGNFFGIFEATEVWNYKNDLARIERNNQALARGETGEFGRSILVRELKAEVPVHYLLNFNRDRAAEAVNRGIEAARAWCDAAGIPRRSGPTYASAASVSKSSVRFTETMKGEIATPVGADVRSGVAIELHLDVHIDDLDHFLVSPEHEALVGGSMTCGPLGGALAITEGKLNLLIDQSDASRKQIIYHMRGAGAEGEAVRIVVTRDLENADAGFVHEATTAILKLYRESAPAQTKPAELGAGTLKTGFADTLKQLASLRVEAPTASERVQASVRFGAFYFGKLWDVYARHLLPVSPF